MSARRRKIWDYQKRNACMALVFPYVVTVVFAIQRFYRYKTISKMFSSFGLRFYYLLFISLKKRFDLINE